MTLPRPVKTVLSDAPRDAAVMRTWARLQRTRRSPKQTSGLGLAVAGLCSVAAGALLVVGWQRAQVLEAMAPAVPAVASAESGARPSLNTLLAQGRTAPAPHAHLVPPTPRPPAPPVAEPAPPADPVHALLESAAEAVRVADYARAATLLAEVADHHRDDPRTPTALFALGRLQAENLHRRADAARSFTRALELGPDERLVVPLWRALEEVRPARAGDGDRDGR
jgi:TolA-binding protein